MQFMKVLDKGAKTIYSLVKLSTVSARLLTIPCKLLIVFVDGIGRLQDRSLICEVERLGHMEMADKGRIMCVILVSSMLLAQFPCLLSLKRRFGRLEFWVFDI